MIRYKSILPILLSFFLFHSGFSQDGIFYEDTYAGDFSICAWNSVILHEYPGRSSRQIGVVLYTEELEHLGKEAFVRGENHNYVWVITRDGSRGWVDDGFLVKNGGVVVMLDNAAIYDKPSTVSARTTQFFRAGEIVILSDFNDGWIRLTGEYKEKTGWVQGYDRISVEESDLEVASVISAAMQIRNLSQRREELKKISSSRGFVTPEMAKVVDMAINSTYETKPPVTTPDPRPNNTWNNTDPWRGGEDVLIDDPNTNIASGNNSGILVKDVIDMQTGRSYQRIYETGSIQPVKNKKAKDIYYAYHKSLPIGSKVLLQVPGTDYTVQLEVIARLREDNPNVIGLGQEVIEKVFGVSQAKNAPPATISYPKGGSL